MAEQATPDHFMSAACQPALSLDFDQRGGHWCVRALGLADDLDPSQLQDLRAVLRVRVAVEPSFAHDDLPDVSGDHRLLGDELWFVPHLPLRAGVLFQATLDLRTLGRLGPSAVQMREFSIPKEPPVAVSRVTEVYPSGDTLPENLLRFYARFSAPMQRGNAEQNVELLGPGGSPVGDALYRAPTELWDPSMTCLTILLDPGRLKRGVGPNRILGSPLEVGQLYTLRVRSGMTDVHGNRLRESFSKTFRVAEPVRDALAVGAWGIRAPAPGSCEPFELTFSRPLDWAQLWRGISVAARHGHALDGRVDVDDAETRWRFTPDEPWQEGNYEVRVSPTLEDVCGNTTSGPFDGPLRSEDEVAREKTVRSIGFAI